MVIFSHEFTRALFDFKPHLPANHIALASGNIYIYIYIVEHWNLNKVIAPRVISMAEGAVIVSRRSHPQTVRPRQWHVIRGGHTVEKEFRRRGKL